jgi:hypothetical protein
MLAGKIGLILTLAGSLAQADVTITSEVHIQNPPDPAQTQPAETQTYTAYFKNDRARVVKGDGTVTLYDFKSNQVYLLTPTDKTYTMLSLNDFLLRDPFPGMQELAGRAMRMKPDVKLDLQKDAVVEPKTFLGQQAQVYDLTGSLTLGPKAPARSSSFGFGRRGRRGGGSSGGGDNGGGFGYSMTRTAQIEGQVWLTAPDALNIKTRISWLPLLRTGVPCGPLTRPMADKVTGAKGFPVASKVTVTGTGTAGPITIDTALKTRFPPTISGWTPISSA